MKKLVFVLMALLALGACSKRNSTPFNYRGLPFSMPFAQFVDSMKARGFIVNPTTSDDGRTIALVKKDIPYHVVVAFNDTELQIIQETYLFSTNDSSRNMWQQIRDGLEKELGAWPDCPKLGEDHKIANFDAGDIIISVVLENTHKPSLMVRYRKKTDKENPVNDLNM